MRISDWSSDVCSSDLAILLDHWIPDFDTSRLITDIRERRPGLPILILTAHNNVAVAVEAMRAGATDFLSKPIAPDRLLAALHSAVSTSSDTGELRPLTEKMPAPLAFEEIVGSRSEEHTSELQSLMRNSYAVFCLKNKTQLNI